MLQSKAVVSAILLTLLCGCTQTGKQTPTVADAAVDPAPSGPEAVAPLPAAATPAMRVFIDPVTGEQRAPTAEEWEEIVRQQQKAKIEAAGAPPPSPSSTPREMTLPDGTRGYVLGDAAKSSLRACTRPDGTTVVGHDCPSTASAPAGVPNEAAP